MARPRASAPRRDDQLRRRVAVEAARLMAEQGIRDFHFAKRKAAERLAVPLDAALPKNSEIEEALREHQRLFDDAYPQRLRALREVAREALRFFARFEPRLVGGVLDGSADRHSAVSVQLFDDEPEAVARFLDEHGISYEESSHVLRWSRDDQRECPAFVFGAGGTTVDATVLPYDRLRQAPLDRSGERPMARADLAALDALLAAPD